MTGTDGYGYGDDSLGKAVMIESDKRMNQAFRRMESYDTWSWDDYFNFIMAGIRWQPDLARQLYAAGQKAMQRGYATPAQAFKPNAEFELRIGVTNTFDMVDHNGGLTGVGSLNFEPDEGMKAFRIYNPSILTANFQTSKDHLGGTVGRINGGLGTGKTNVACVIMEQWVSEAPNHIAISNVRMLVPDPRVKYASQASELFKIVSELPPGSVILFVLDEGGLTYNKPDQSTRRVKDLDKLMRIIRKLHISFVLVEQREDSVPNLIMEWARNIYLCKAKGIVSIELRGPELAFRDTVKSFPKATLPFDTDDPAMFDIDINVEKLLWAVTDQDDKMAALSAFLKTSDAYTAKKEVPCKEPGCDRMRAPGNKLYCDVHKRVNVLGYGTITASERSKRGLEEKTPVEVLQDGAETTGTPSPPPIKKKPASLSEFLV